MSKVVAMPPIIEVTQDQLKDWEAYHYEEWSSTETKFVNGNKIVSYNIVGAPKVVFKVKEEVDEDEDEEPVQESYQNDLDLQF